MLTTTSFSLRPDRGAVRSVLLDADDLRVTCDHAAVFDLAQGFAHRVLGRRVGDQNDGSRRLRAVGIVAAVVLP